MAYLIISLHYLQPIINLVIPQISFLNKGNNTVSIYCFLDQFSRQSYLDLLPAELNLCRESVSKIITDTRNEKH